MTFFKNKQLYILLKDELKSLENIKTVFFLILGMIGLLYVTFSSRTIQLIILYLFGSVKNISFYHIISFNILVLLWPIICLIINYDVINKDFKNKNIRLIITKIKRSNYLLSKIISRIILLVFGLIMIVLFISGYTYIKMGNPSIIGSTYIFISFTMLTLFLSSIFIFISTISKSPLVIASLIPLFTYIISSVMPITQKYSYYYYLTLNNIEMNQIIFFITGTIIILMTNIFYFNRKQI
jgi:ABC-2 type transport system permease protein